VNESNWTVDLSVQAPRVVPAVRPVARGFLIRRWWVDAIAAAALVALSTTVAYRYVNEHFALAYDSAYRDCTEDLLYPCVGQLGSTIDAAALEASAHWQAFMQGRIGSLSCDALRELPRVSAGHLSNVQRYLHASLSAVFWWRGPQRSVYVGYMTAMVGLTVIAAYGLFRLGAGPLIASLVTLPFIFSDLHLRNALHPAEYVKAPFFLGCLFLVGAIVVRDVGRRGVIALSAAAGAILGLGIGFKTDVLICVPIAVVMIVAFAPKSIGPSRRVTAALIFLCSVLLSGWPVLKAQFLGDQGSLFPVQVLGGMYRNFDDYYAQPSLYDYGIRFDDTHITYLINSYDQRVNGSTKFVEFYSKQMQKASMQLVADIERTFPGDFLLRSFASVVNVLKLGRFGIPAALVVLLGLCLTNLRLGSCVAFLLCSAVGYVSLVFQTKHFFHLEWVPWWFTAVAVEQAIVRARGVRPLDFRTAPQRTQRWMRNHALRIAALALVVLAALVVFVAARQLQQSRVSALVADAMRHANDERLATAMTVADDGSTRLTVEGLGSAPHATPLVEDYLVLDVECSAPSDATVIGVYAQATSPREPMTVPCSRGSLRWKLFWPVYQYPPASRLRWFETSNGATIRIQSIDRVSAARRAPLLLKLAVPDDYQRRRWYHTLRRRFFIEPLGVSQSF